MNDNRNYAGKFVKDALLYTYIGGLARLVIAVWIIQFLMECTRSVLRNWGIDI